MPGSAGSIYVDLLLSDGRYREGLNRASAATKQATNQWSRDIQKTQQSFASVVNPVTNVSAAVANLGGVVAGALSVQKIAQYSDTWKQLQGRLGLVSNSSVELAATQERLFKIAQDSRSDLGATVTLYQRLTSATQGLGVSQEDVFKFTEQLNKQLITAGLTSTEASAAVYQLTQAFNKGKLDGDEFRTILESAPPILEALTVSLGKTRGEILQLSKDGQLGPRVLIDAVNGMAEVTDQRFADFSLTIGQSFQQLDNAFLRYIGNTKAIQGGTTSVALAVSGLAQNFELLADAAIVASVALTGRFAVGMAQQVIPVITAAIAQAIAYNTALAAMAGGATAAAVRTAAAMTLLRGALAGVGALLTGPVGIVLGISAAAAGFLYLKSQTDQAELSQQKYNDTLGQLKGLHDSAIATGQEYTADLVKQRQEIIKNAEAEVTRAKALVQLQELMAESGRGFGTQQSARDALPKSRGDLQAKIDELDGILSQINRDMNKESAPRANKPGAGGGSASDAKKTQNELSSLYEKNRELITGLDSATLNYIDTQAELERLEKAGIISKKELAESVRRLDDQYRETTETANQWGFDVAAAAKRGAENVQDALADFLFDPASKGFRGMLSDFVNVVKRMASEAASARILEGLFGKSDGKGGAATGGILSRVANSVGGFFKSIFAGQFAEGGFIPPGQFGVAGEREAELVFGGRTGATVIPPGKGKPGNVYQIDARGADAGAVARLEQTMLALAGPGVIERRVGSAQSRGVLT